MKKYYLIFLIALLSSCDDDKNINKLKPYTGPILQAQHISTVYSDSARRKVEVSGPLQNQYQDQNVEYPHGMRLTFYNEKEQKSAMLKGQKGFFDKNKNLYTASGDVVVIDMIDKKILKTEELHWSPVQKEIFTDKFVVVNTPKQIIKGKGFTAKQDFSVYKVLKPTAIINVDDQKRKKKKTQTDSTKTSKSKD